MGAGGVIATDVLRMPVKNMLYATIAMELEPSCMHNFYHF